LATFVGVPVVVEVDDERVVDVGVEDSVIVDEEVEEEEEDGGVEDDDDDDSCCETGTEQDEGGVTVTTCVSVAVRVVACVCVNVVVTVDKSTEQSFSVVTNSDACDRDFQIGHAKHSTIGSPKYKDEQKQAVPFDVALVPQFEQASPPVMFL
jgi:hypothetical protein